MDEATCGCSRGIGDVDAKVVNPGEALSAVAIY